jgi:pimeloyl-ACP methyl ester carboxylesterase
MPEGTRAGHPVHWRSFGTGPESALLLHCALAHSGAWTGVAEALSDRLTATAPDMPGHGRSGDWDGVRDVHDLVTDIAESFLGPRTHLVGHSFGATVALRLAETYPERVATLTLIEPVLFAAARDEAPDLFEANLDAGAPAARHAADGDWDAAARAFTGRWGGGPDWTSLPDAARARMAAQMPQVMATGDVLNEDSKGLLAPDATAAVRAPVMLVRGGDSPPILGAIHRGLAARLPVVEDVVVPGAGHMVPISHPDAVAGAIRSHLDRAGDLRAEAG